MGDREPMMVRKTTLTKNECLKTGADKSRRSSCQDVLPGRASKNRLANAVAVSI